MASEGKTALRPLKLASRLLFDIVRDVRLTLCDQTRRADPSSSTLPRWRKHEKFKIGLRRALRPDAMDSPVTVMTLSHFARFTGRRTRELEICVGSDSGRRRRYRHDISTGLCLFCLQVKITIYLLTLSGQSFCTTMLNRRHEVCGQGRIMMVVARCRPEAKIHNILKSQQGCVIVIYRYTIRT